MSTEEKKVSVVFKALCDENRVAIIQELQKGEKCACKLGEAVGLFQSKLSYHMKILVESGLVETWAVGKWSHYKISSEGFAYAKSLLEKLECNFEIEQKVG